MELRTVELTKDALRESRGASVKAVSAARFFAKMYPLE